MTTRPPLGSDLLRMSAKIFTGILVTLLSLFAILAVFGGIGAGGSAVALRDAETLLGDAKSDNKILQISINGPILTHAPKQPGFFGGLSGDVTYGYEVKKQLLAAAKDDDIKAVVLKTSTPGGSIVGSNAIHEGVLAVKAAGKPVITYVDTISASGGVWSTAASDAIFADHGSLIGSVGVIFSGFMEYNDPVAIGGFFQSIETRGGIKVNTITAGKSKDIGNPFRPMTEPERAMFQAMVDEFYGKFIAHVETYRGISREALTSDFGAGIFANDAAEAHGYINGTKSWEESVAYAAEAADVGEDYRLVAPPSEEAGPFGMMAFFNQGTPESRMQAHQAMAQQEIVSACAALSREVSIISPAHFYAMCGR